MGALQVGREDVLGGSGRGGLLHGGVAEVQHAGRLAAAGDAERRDPPLLRNGRHRGQAVPAPSQGQSRLGEAFRPEMGRVPGEEEEVRPESDPLPWARDLRLSSRLTRRILP